jgi:hypothetical protein
LRVKSLGCFNKLTKNQLEKIRKNRHWHNIYATASIIKHQALELQGQCYKSMLQITKHLTKYPDMKSIFNKTTVRRVTDLPSQVAASAKSRGDRTCQHGRFQPYCKACKGNMLCVHLRHKNRCAACTRSSAMSTSASGGNSGVVFQ